MAEAENGTEAVQLCRKKRPDIILMDIGLPGLNGIETTSEILRHFPDVKIDHSVDVRRRAFRGERDPFRRARLRSEESFRQRSAGRAAHGRQGRLLSEPSSFRPPAVSAYNEAIWSPSPRPPALDDLSPRELQVLRLVAEGKTSKEIAVMLDLGLQTVRSYRKTMMKKLGVSNVAGLTQVALAAGITRFPIADGNHRPNDATPPGECCRSPTPTSTSSRTVLLFARRTEGRCRRPTGIRC